MATFNATNPVGVGLATKKDHFDRVFDNTVAIQEGNIALAKVAFDGTGTAPSVSASGDATVYYDTNEDKLMLSKNAGAYEPLGQFLPNDATLCGGTAFGFTE